MVLNCELKFRFYKEVFRLFKFRILDKLVFNALFTNEGNEMGDGKKIGRK